MGLPRILPGIGIAPPSREESPELIALTRLVDLVNEIVVQGLPVRDGHVVIDQVNLNQSGWQFVR